MGINKSHQLSALQLPQAAEDAFVMHGSILHVTIPSRAYPRGFAIFFSLGGLFHTPGQARRKRQFPTPGTPHRPQIRCFAYKT